MENAIKSLCNLTIQLMQIIPPGTTPQQCLQNRWQLPYRAWRGIYKWSSLILIIMQHPPENARLGYSQTWWDARYGEAPYISAIQYGKILAVMVNYTDATGLEFTTLTRRKRPDSMNIIL